MTQRIYCLIFKYLLLILLALVLPFMISAKESTGGMLDYILIIDSDTETCAWSEFMIPLIISEIEKEHPDLPIYIDYMFSLEKTTEKSIKKFKDSIFSKYSTPPKYLLLIESNTYGILHEDIRINWGNDIPIVLLAREDYIGPEKYYIKKEVIPQNERVILDSITASRKNLTVVYNPFDLSATVSLMKNIYPNMAKILFVTDGRYISARLRDELQQTVSANYPDLLVEYITPETHTSEELIHTLTTTFKKDTGILYFTWSANKLKNMADLILGTNIYRIFSLYTDSPVFTINDIGLEESGLLGGCFTPYNQVVNSFVNTVDYVIDGRLGSRFVYCPTPVPTFNYAILQDLNISKEVLPKNSYFYNKPLGFLEKNKNLLMGFAISIFLGLVFIRIIILTKNRKMQEKEIRLLEKYSDLVSNMPFGYLQGKLIFNEKGTLADYIITETNPDFTIQLNLKTEIIGERISTTIPQILTILAEEYEELLKYGRKRATIPYSHEETNSYFSIIFSLSSTQDYIDIFFVDTTELFNTQQQLQTTNRKLQVSLEVAEITPWRWDIKKEEIKFDVNPNISYYKKRNHSQKELTVITPEEFFNRIHQDDRGCIRGLFTMLMNGEITKFRKEFRYSHTLLKKDYEWLEINSVIAEKDSKGCVLSLMGSSLLVSERKKIEQELVTAKEKAEESNKLKSTFLANISHEIRTPLNAIVGFSSVLLASDECDTERPLYVNLIENNSALLLQLVNDILDLSKIESGAIDKDYSDVDLNSLMEELLGTTSKKVCKDVQVLFEQKNYLCPIRTEKKWLLQVLCHLLDNAAKFTEQGSISYGFSVQDENMLYFYVKDTGIGIGPARKQEIFDRFIKLDYFVQGAGLGLSICETIVKQFGGTIGLESEKGKGSTFWFTFPYSKVEETVG